MIRLRPHQVTAIEDTNKRFGTKNELGEIIRNVLLVLPTGAGKSLVLADYAKWAYENNIICVVFAHRDVLISQLSEAMCKTGVPHTFICSDKARRDITNNNLALFGDSYYEKESCVIVSSNPTFAARVKSGKISAEFCESVGLWLQDEVHHLVEGNQWHTCLEPMVNAMGIGVTATPKRGDKKGLGRHADGMFDDISVTTNTYNLIKDKMLCAYKVFETGQIDVSGIKKDKGREGDLNKRQLHIKTKEADITGSAIEEYMHHLAGKQVITFCINIEHAKEVAADFNAAGIPSVAVSSKQPLHERQQAMDDMAAGRILNLVNVDLLGEGYDCPAVAGVIMLRRTVSYSLYKQQFGRMLRNADGKVYGVLLDHVGNTRYMMETYGLLHPHDDPVYTLDSDKDSKSKLICPECDSEKFYDGHCADCGYVEEPPPETIKCEACKSLGIVGTQEQKDAGSDIGLIFVNGVCPECGHVETEGEKTARVRELKVKEGKLVELPNDIIDSLIEKRESFYLSVPEFASTLSDSFQAKGATVNRHAERQTSLNVLRHWIQKWSEHQWTTTGKPAQMVQIEFELTFGVHVLVAQAGSGPDMNQLTAKIQQHMTGNV